MKVRWTKNSIRLRITPEELAQLQNDQSINEHFLVWHLDGWSVRVRPSAATSLEMHHGDLVFSLAKKDIVQLSEAECEGVYFLQDDVRFYIEKDFPCAHPRAGEAAEMPTPTFAPPTGFEARKNV